MGKKNSALFTKDAGSKKLLQHREQHYLTVSALNGNRVLMRAAIRIGVLAKLRHLENGTRQPWLTPNALKARTAVNGKHEGEPDRTRQVPCK